MVWLARRYPQPIIMIIHLWGPGVTVYLGRSVCIYMCLCVHVHWPPGRVQAKGFSQINKINKQMNKFNELTCSFMADSVYRMLILLYRHIYFVYAWNYDIAI